MNSPQIMRSVGLDYELLDSGNGRKLERFGTRILLRPSSICIWKKLGERWGEADATFVPGQGWGFRGKPFEEWDLDAGEGLSFRLRLQRSGQVGIFPEHALYLPEVLTALRQIKGGGAPRVLNLFAFTGLASLYCVCAGAEVTHLDKSKQALAWAMTNFELNSLGSKVRLIADDAIAFLKREKRRAKCYDVIIADPPNFSRISRAKTWELDRVVIDLVEGILALLDRGGFFFISCHQGYGFAETVENLLYQYSGRSKIEVSSTALSLKETSTPRRLPAGMLVRGRVP
ncbi:MAG: hypothetical protein GX589_05760 [Deltaproteobacteria bacterium]|nr:hypothetical protein [Deltaproteobacteria bacterium]